MVFFILIFKNYINYINYLFKNYLAFSSCLYCLTVGTRFEKRTLFLDNKAKLRNKWEWYSPGFYFFNFFIKFYLYFKRCFRNK
jgi:hypothetical protein